MAGEDDERGGGRIPGFLKRLFGAPVEAPAPIESLPEPPAASTKAT